MKAPLLIIAAGGTGGHMFPAQALAEEMLARGWRVALSTDARGLRYAGGFSPAVERRALSAATFARGGMLAKALAPLMIAKGVAQALLWFLKERPAAVCGFGGYPAMPALMAAILLRRPAMIHEQNGVPGRVNRRFAARVKAFACGIWPLVRELPGAKLHDIGNPLRAAALAAAETPYSPPDAGEIRLLIFGGSQGASVFARLGPEALAALPEEMRSRITLTQQAREAEVEGLKSCYAALGLKSKVAPFFDDMPERIAASHLVISRAGASSVAELAAIGRPSILVPLPGAMDDHQTANARPLAAAGAALLAPEAGLTGEGLARHIRAIAGDAALAAKMAAAAKFAGRPDAAQRLADLTETLAKGMASS